MLSAGAPVDLVVAVSPPGERLPGRRVGLQVGCLPDPVPQAILGARPDPRGNRPGIELGIEHVLQIIQVVLTVVVVAEQVPHERDLRLLTVRFSRPVQDIGVLPLGAGIIDPQAVVVVPRYEVKIRRADEIIRCSPASRIVEIVIRPGRVIVVPAAEQHVDGRPPQEGRDVHDAVHRLAEGVRIETSPSAGQPDAVDRPDEAGQVVVGVSLGVILVGLEAVGALGGSGDEILTSRVIPVAPGPVFQMRTTDVSVAGLVKVSPEVLAEVISQEILVDMLDDREEAPVGTVEGQFRVCVPRGGNTRDAEQAPGQRFAHLRRVVVHRLEIDPGHSSQPVAVA